MLRVLIIELKRSPSRWITGVLVVVQVALMASDAAAWRGVWPMASAEVGAHWLFLGPIFAGFSAWETLRRVRDQPRVLSAEQRCQLAVSLVARLLMAWCVVISGSLFAVGVNIVTGAPAGFLWPSYILIALALSVESVAVGHAIATFGGPLWFSPTISLMLVFLRLVWFQGAGTGTSDSVLSRVFLDGRPWIVLDRVGVFWSIVEAALVVAVAIFLPRIVDWLRTRRDGHVFAVGTREMLGLGIVVAISAMALVGVVNGPPITGYRAPPQVPLCTSTSFAICFWPDDAIYLSEATPIASRASEVAASLQGPSLQRLNEFNVTAPQQGGFVILEGSTWSLIVDVSDTIAASLAPLSCSINDSAPPGDVSAYYQSLWELSAMLQLQIGGNNRPADYGDSTGIDWAGVVSVWREGSRSIRIWEEQRIASAANFSSRVCS